MVRIVSESRAYDAAIRALVDAARVAAGLDSWLIVGGHMVNLHILRTGIDLATRATRDADLAVELLAIRDGALLDRLRDLGYRNTQSSNRFDRTTTAGTAAIDLLTPSYSSRHRPNMEAGEIFVDGFPALHLALARPPVVVDFDAVLTDGTRMAAEVNIPDVISAIAVKVSAYAERFAPRDAEDLYSLLEVAHMEDSASKTWPDQPSFATAARQLSTFFDVPGAALGTATRSAQQRVRLRALVRSLVGRSRRGENR
jgi:predicted nucleotidyltransferase